MALFYCFVDLCSYLTLWTGFFSLKKQANSLHFSVERSSGAICLGGFVSLSTIANRVRVLLMFFLVISEKCR